MDYKLQRQSMTCGRSEASSRKYKKLKGKSGKSWYISLQENEGDNVYVSANPIENTPGYKGFRGFGGSTIEFELEDGTIDQAQGPWHSNTDALFHDTGYDARDKHLTFGVISRDFGPDPEDKWGGGIMKDVIWMDDEPVVGFFNRVEEIAKEIANKEGKPVMCYSESTGGSSRGQVRPTWMENI